MTGMQPCTGAWTRQCGFCSVGRRRIQSVRATPRVGGVHMGRPKGWTTAVTGRPTQRVPGHPGLRREHRQVFWAAIARGLRTEDAAAEAGISTVVGARWFNQGGGMSTVSPLPMSRRFLSFAEREDIAVHRASGCGVREIARLTALPVDDLERTPQKRCDGAGSARLPRVQRTVARRLSSPTPEGRQARGPRCPSRLRSGAPL